MTPHLNRLVETVQMTGHNIGFYEELTRIIPNSKIFPNYHQILPLIWSSGDYANKIQATKRFARLSSEKYHFHFRDLHNNHISWTIEDMKGAFMGLDSLRELNLINNRIKTITKQAFMGLTRLEKLELLNNNITTIHGNTFDETPELRQL